LIGGRFYFKGFIYPRKLGEQVFTGKYGGDCVAYVKTSIRELNFNNFNYDIESTFCSEILEKSSILLKSGEYGNYRNFWFSIDENRTIYGDITCDGREEAVVLTMCGGMHATEQPYIYTIKNGQVILLAKLQSSNRAMGGYTRSGLCRGCINGFEINNGILTVERMWGKPACCPEYVEKKKYKWNGNRFVQIGGSLRRKFVNK